MPAVVRRLAVVVVAMVLVGVASLPAGSVSVVRGVSTDAGFRWRPRITEVARSSRVVWKAVDGSHTVTSYGGGWSKNTTLPEGQQTSFTFNSRGTFKFRCTILFHSTLSSGTCSGMCGKVVVS